MCLARHRDVVNSFSSTGVFFHALCGALFFFPSVAVSPHTPTFLFQKSSYFLGVWFSTLPCVLFSTFSKSRWIGEEKKSGSEVWMRRADDHSD